MTIDNIMNIPITMINALYFTHIVIIQLKNTQKKMYLFIIFNYIISMENNSMIQII